MFSKFVNIKNQLYQPNFLKINKKLNSILNSFHKIISSYIELNRMQISKCAIFFCDGNYKISKKIYIFSFFNEFVSIIYFLLHHNLHNNFQKIKKKLIKVTLIAHLKKKLTRILV